MSCSHSSNCQLYPLLAMESALLLWKKHYCEGDFKKCHRYTLSLEGKSIPLTLLPNGKMLEKRTSNEINAAALFNAIEKKRVPVVKSILKLSLDKSTLRTSDGLTPLMAATLAGSEEIVKIVLEFGCNPWAKTRNGKTALDYAISSGNRVCEDLIRAELSSTSEEDFKQSNRAASGKQTEEDEISFVKSFLRKINPFGSKKGAA